MGVSEPIPAEGAPTTMNLSRTLILSVCALFTGAATGMAQDAIPIPAPSGTGQSAQMSVQQWVQPNAEGLLIGQIISIDDGPVGRCDIAIVDSKNVVKQFSSDGGGKVTIRGVPPGSYAMAVRGENLIATYALNVVPPAAGDASRDANFTVMAARIDSQKFYGQIVRYIPIEGAPPYVSDPAELQAASRKIGQVAGLPRVQQVDGGLEGCLFGAGIENGNLTAAPQTYVFVLQDGLEVARVVTDDQGCYRFDDLAPGRYSFIAVGQSGVVATGFELVASGASADARKQDAAFRLVSTAQPPGGIPPGPPGGVPSGQFNVQMASPQGALSGFEAMDGPGGPGEGPPFPLPPGEFMPPPGYGGGFAGGGGPGGGMGGGGAGGGGGGIGGLLGIAGLALGIAALADDDDDFRPPRPSSPARPGRRPPGIPPGPPGGIPPGPPPGRP